MFTRLTALLNTTSVRLAMAGILIGSGIAELQKIVKERGEEIKSLDGQLAARRGMLAVLNTRIEHARARVPYPAAEDLDPLQRGGDTEPQAAAEAS